MNKYQPELLFGLMALIQNVAIVIACAWTTVNLYKMSGSWHALWALLMLGCLVKMKFIRD